MASSPSQTNPNSFHTDFCLRLAYKVLQKQIQNGSNFVSSPLSLHIILSLVAAGAKGKTLEELLSFLGSPTKGDLNSASSQIVSSLKNVEGTENGGPNLSFVNGAWVDKTFGLKASFEELVKNVYKSPIEEVDFKNKAEEVAKEVNSWTEKETNGLIRELLPPGYINKKTVLVLGNALYFKGAWNGKKFDPTMTETKSFHLLNGGMCKELTELLSDCSKGDRILVSKIVQKAFVEVSEEGTEAAASTDAVLDYEVALFNFPSPPKPKPILFVADHPFLFMIREETSMAVFFIGSVLNPLLDS
ncbi:hypothetical protein K1719_044592 [Acacia pycnantha]|nr:hypothetical protein K1719_044592 [Acacia pycnantha]